MHIASVLTSPIVPTNPNSIPYRYRSFPRSPPCSTLFSRGDGWSYCRHTRPKLKLRAAPSDAPAGDPPSPDIKLENVKREVDVYQDDQDELDAWNQLLESFREQMLLIQNVSDDAYKTSLMNAMRILQLVSNTLKIQAGQASSDILKIVKETSKEGKEYIDAATETLPDTVKDVMETLSTLPSKLTDFSKLDDFYVGISYGILLSSWGFSSFMFTGSISAIRFGIVLGTSLLAMGISSLRAQRKAQSSSLLLKGQLVIVAIIFLRQWQSLFQKPSLLTFATTFFSGTVLIFYAYKILTKSQNKRPN